MSKPPNVRDLMFKGLRTFKEFQNAGEGIASNVLTDRLLRLESSGILTKRRDPQDARKIIYRLTAKGVDLAPVLVEMVLWSARHEHTDAPARVVREMRTQRKRFIAQVRRTWSKAGDEAR